MSPEISDLFKRAMELPADQRAALASSLLDSLDEESGHSADEAWEQEVARRMNELKAGGAVTIPWEDAQRQIRARVNGRE
jgi:putative addiction module component (TIGR02574 family)